MGSRGIQNGDGGMNPAQKKRLYHHAYLQFYRYNVVNDWIIETHIRSNIRLLYHACKNEELNFASFQEDNVCCSNCGMLQTSNEKAVLALIMLEIWPKTNWSVTIESSVVSLAGIAVLMFGSYVKQARSTVRYIMHVRSYMILALFAEGLTNVMIAAMNYLKI